MTISRHYTLITPRADRTGPTNVAVDIGRAAAAAGWQVRLLYLSGRPLRDDLTSFAEVRQWRLRDLWLLDGVIHTHCLRPDLVGWLFSWNKRCKVMTTLHNYFLFDLGFDHSRWKVRLAWSFWSHALRRFNHRVCISAAMRRYYRRVLPNLSFDLAYNFREAPKAQEAASAPQIEEWLQAQRVAKRIVLAYVGALNERKNVGALLTAVADMPEVALVICGQGPQVEQLKLRAAQGDLSNRILMVGQLTDPRAVIASSDLLVLPSRAEGLPLVVLEASQVGRPTLMSNIAVHRELSSFGLGMTFDHHRFADFRAKTHMLAGVVPRLPDPTLVSIWQRHFSSGPGFQQYANLVGAPAVDAR